jgi:hypothetical protein
MADEKNWECTTDLSDMPPELAEGWDKLWYLEYLVKKAAIEAEKAFL